MIKRRQVSVQREMCHNSIYIDVGVAFDDIIEARASRTQYDGMNVQWRYIGQEGAKKIVRLECA